MSQPARKQRAAQHIQVGMTVLDKKGDLGGQDLSPARIKAVRHNERGEVEAILVEKGAVFRKDLEIPADRILSVNSARRRGQVTVDVQEEELKELSPRRKEQQIASEPQARQHAREIQADQRRQEQRGSWWLTWLRQLGPGLLGGLSGNDPSAVGAYAIDGAQAGFGHLWLLLLSTPMYQAVLYTCAKIGRVSHQGFAEVLRTHYGRPLAIVAALVLIVANVSLIAADLVAIGSGFMLLTGINWIWFVVPAAALLWYVVTYTNFAWIKRIFMVLSLAFLAYVITAFLAHPNWGQVLLSTVVPHLNVSFADISSAMALLGATLSPYTMFWQVQGELEERRPGPLRIKLHYVTLDIGMGAICGNIVAYFIIVTTAATLFTHHHPIATVEDAAGALTPLLGPFAKDVFAIGLIGAGAVAIPILLASTAYAITGTIGWPAGLSTLPWENEGFYLILSGALLVSLVLALLHLDPVKLIFWANILNGVLAPILVALIMLMANNQRIMHKHCVGWFTNGWLLLTILVLLASALLLFWGLLTGQSSS
jgi:Mn2+/Fe2+ NRAMP family transporter